MRFAAPYWLFGTAFALVVAALLVAGGVMALKGLRRFGDEAPVRGLITANASNRRVFKGVLLVLAVAFGFLALAEPQYGRGTRRIPATNLDVVIVLDYSKSMYARDVKPSRSVRAKSEVAELISELPGARFGAVAFAGQPMGFPLTTDGAAISQFFRQLSPNDMPVGGTAIARALEAGRDLLARDPLTEKHKKVLLLVTDGEDLEGDPVSVAESAKQAGITIDVVQIGGRTPEPVPDVNEAGEFKGYRTDEDGKPITTSLSADGEAQLAKIAQVTGGMVVRSARGETGIREVATALKHLMSEELSERVETVYADVYQYPLGLALVLLLIETFVPDSRRRGKASRVPPPIKTRTRHQTARAPDPETQNSTPSTEREAPVRRERIAAAATITGAALLLVFLLSGCEEADRLFTRHVPAVDEALSALDAGDASAAVGLLENYLQTGTCENGQIGRLDDVHQHVNAGFDLGLTLFKIGEKYGPRFGEEAPHSGTAPTPEQELQGADRKNQIECALRVVRLIGGESSTPIDLRARAHYLAGNLEFLRGDYRAAVTAYDLSLKLIPGLPVDAGDSIGRDAAYNRAIALRKIEEEKHPDAGPDSGNQPDAAPDAGKPDSGNPDSGRPDSGKDDKDSDGGGKPEPDGAAPAEPDAAADAGNPNSEPDAGPPNAGDAGAPPETPKDQAPSVNQDERILDMLEGAPTLQEHEAKKQALTRGNSGMVDK